MSVFDTSAVLAIIYGEEGGLHAKARLKGSVFSVVNLAEVAGDLVLTGKGEAHEAAGFVEQLGLRIVTPTPSEVARVGELRPIRGLSLGDRFCIALGEARGEPLITSDQQWPRVPGLRTSIEMIR